MFRKNVLNLIIVVSTLFVASTPLYAVPVDLVIFNNPALAADPDLKFTVEALNGGSETVNFIITNLSTMDSTIKQVFFDGDDLLNIFDVINSAGVNGDAPDFEADASPGNLPGGNNSTLLASFGGVFTDDFSASANPPPAHNGIDHGESITVKFNVSGDADTIIGQLNDGTLRVGAHIISVGCDEVSVSAVSTPEPATIALLGLGFLALLKKRSGK